MHCAHTYTYYFTSVPVHRAHHHHHTRRGGDDFLARLAQVEGADAAPAPVGDAKSATGGAAGFIAGFLGGSGAERVGGRTTDDAKQPTKPTKPTAFQLSTPSSF